jgi:hypothetical protein
MTKTENMSTKHRVGEEELALAHEGGACEKEALKRRLSSSSGEGDAPENQSGREQARQILDAATAAKKIARADLKRAVALYAGPQATDKEKAAVASKVMEFLSKKQIAVAA